MKNCFADKKKIWAPLARLCCIVFVFTYLIVYFIPNCATISSAEQCVLVYLFKWMKSYLRISQYARRYMFKKCTGSLEHQTTSIWGYNNRKVIFTVDGLWDNGSIHIPKFFKIKTQFLLSCHTHGWILSFMHSQIIWISSGPQKWLLCIAVYCTRTYCEPDEWTS